MAEAASQAPTTPSGNLVRNLRAELMQALPFSRMLPAHVDQFVAGASLVHFAPDEVVLEPSHGAVDALNWIRKGSVTGRRGMADAAGAFEYVAGDLFPVRALLASCAVTATYFANEDLFCLLLPAKDVVRLAELSPPFAEFLHHKVMHLLDLSRRAARASWARPCKPCMIDRSGRFWCSMMVARQWASSRDTTSWPAWFWRSAHWRRLSAT
jgi:CBS domain-containing protein